MTTTENPTIPTAMSEPSKVQWRHHHPKLYEGTVGFSGVLIGSFVGLSLIWMVTNLTHFPAFDTFLLLILSGAIAFFGAILGGIGAILSLIYQHLKDSK
jgi:apolipoprotein N-acyltransferase